MGTVRKIVWGLVLAGCCFAGSPALAQKRVALVIGNSSYDKVARLANPANDAALVANTLKAAGFDDVELRRDLKIADMRRALRDFIGKSRDADVAVVYYAGHGIESTAQTTWSRLMLFWTVTRMSTTRRCRWSASWSRSSPRRSCAS